MTFPIHAHQPGTAATSDDVDFDRTPAQDYPADPYRIYPGPLPPDELAKLDRIERGESASSRMKHLWQRLTTIGHAKAGNRLDRALTAADIEMLHEVPLGLLCTKDRQSVSDLRAYGAGTLDHLPRNLDVRRAFTLLKPRLQAAMDLPAFLAVALAGLARWESEPGPPGQSSARARGADAVREAIDLTTPYTDRQTLHDIEIGKSHAPPSRDVALPPPSLLKHLKFVGNNLVMDLGDARPVDGKAFRSSAEFLKVRSLTMMATSDEPSPSTWIPATVRTVHLTGDGGDRSNAVTLTKALVAQAPATLEDIFTPRLMLEEFDTAMPDWSRRGRVLSRVRALGYPVCLRRFLPKGSTLGEQWWRRVCDRPGAAEFSRFLTSLDISLTALGQLPQDTARRQQCATQVQRLIRALTAAPELLDELQADLAVAAPCVDAKMLLLNQFDLYLFPDIAAQEPAGALVRMALFQAVDRHVALTDDRAENIERGQALRALVDFRLAALARKRFQHTPRPWYRKIAGMNAVSWFRPNAGPASSDWPPEMHKAVDRILGEQVRAGFPEVRELLSATSGPIARVADRLREDPAYRKARLAWEAAFLEAGERAESAHAMPEDQERYARLQAEMPDRQAQHQLALMKEWLDPLRKAYPMSGRA